MNCKNSSQGETMYMFVLAKYYKSNIHLFIKHLLFTRYWPRQWDYSTNLDRKSL